MAYSSYYSGARESERLPVYNGFIVLELSSRPVKYHFASTFIDCMDAQESHQMAMASCRIACRTADVVRGRYNLQHLSRAMTKPCMNRLGVMRGLFESHMLANPDIKVRLGYLPVVPTLIDGVIVSKEIVEMAVFVSIGRDRFCVNLKFKFIGSRWMCIFADFG